MEYTWEEALYSIDTRQEAKAKEKQREEIEEKQLAEAKASSIWSLGLSLLGGAIFGPVGYFVGKQLGKYGVDIAYDWETDTVDPGKFNVEDTKKFNKTIAKAAKDQDLAQMVGTLTDLGTMWVQAGGLKEGFDPSIGGGDWTTFGTGDDAWTVFSDESIVGKGLPLPSTDKRLGLPFIDAKTLPKGQTLFTGGYNPLDTLEDIYKGGTKSPLGQLITGGGQD